MLKKNLKKKKKYAKLKFVDLFHYDNEDKEVVD